MEELKETMSAREWHDWLRYFNRYGPPHDTVRLENASLYTAAVMSGTKLSKLAAYPAKRDIVDREEDMPQAQSIYDIAAVMGVSPPGSDKGADD